MLIKTLKLLLSSFPHFPHSVSFEGQDYLASTNSRYKRKNIQNPMVHEEYLPKSQQCLNLKYTRIYERMNHISQHMYLLLLVINQKFDSFHVITYHRKPTTAALHSLKPSRKIISKLLAHTSPPSQHNNSTLSVYKQDCKGNATF